MKEKIKKILDLIEDNDTTIKATAEKLNIPRTTLSNYLHGATEPPREFWIKISEIFNVSIDYLMDKTNNPNTDNFTEGMEEEDIKELERYKELLKIKRQVEKNKKISTSTNEN